MPSLLDYKDSKNIIIYLFMILLALATYVYKGDQSAITERYKAAEKSVAENHLKLEALFKKECSSISLAVAATITDQKEMRREMRVMALDINTLKVIKDYKKGIAEHGN